MASDQLPESHLLFTLEACQTGAEVSRIQCLPGVRPACRAASSDPSTPRPRSRPSAGRQPAWSDRMHGARSRLRRGTPTTAGRPAPPVLPARARPAEPSDGQPAAGGRCLRPTPSPPRGGSSPSACGVPPSASLSSSLSPPSARSRCWASLRTTQRPRRPLPSRGEPGSQLCRTSRQNLRGRHAFLSTAERWAMRDRTHAPRRRLRRLPSWLESATPGFPASLGRS